MDEICTGALSRLLDEAGDFLALIKSEHAVFALPIRLPGHASGSAGRLAHPAPFRKEDYSRRWPEVVHTDPEVRAKVDALWEELGLG